MHRLIKSASAIVFATLLSSLGLAGDLSATAKATAVPQRGVRNDSSPASIRLDNGFVSITRMQVTTQRRDGEWTADVTCHITINGFPNVPMIFEAALVDGEGNIHTNKRNQPYVASREVGTGEWSDTDKYTVTIPLAGLFPSRAPDLFVRARVLDSSKKVLATGVLQSFTPPKD